MSEWRAVRFHPRILMALVLLLLGLAAFRFWEVTGHAGMPAKAGLEPRPELLVEPAWLAAHLNDSSLRVVDLRTLADYQAGHIPGAVHLDSALLFTERGGVQAMLPELPQVEQILRQAGIESGTTVIGYDGNAGLSAARLFFALDYAGQGNGRVLNGGWDAWKAASGAVSTDVPSIAPSTFTAKPQSERAADVGWILERLGDGQTAILDARSAREYEGKSGNAKRLGHIPGAASLEWSESLAPGTQRFRAPEELLAMLAARGITPDKEVVPYCQSFARAAHSYFTLRWLGFTKVRGYDGSWFEWGNHPDTPIEQGPPPELAPPSGALDPAGEPTQLQEGLTEAQVKRLLGEPQRVEMQNPCWGKQSVWRYQDAPSAQGPLRLTFLDGILRQIGR